MQINLDVYEKDRPRIPDLILRLHNTPSGSVELRAVDANGHLAPSGRILQITNTGELELAEFIDPSLGLKLDSRGRIIVTNKLAGGSI